MIKERIKSYLKKRGFYYRIKYSSFFRAYERVFKPASIKQHNREVDFYQSFLPHCNLIFDIGANDGHKTEAFLSISDRVVCCEPEQGNLEILRARLRKKMRRVFIEESAVIDKEGTAELYVHHPGSAFNTLSHKWMKLLENDGIERWNESITFSGTTKVTTTTLDQLIKKHGRPDFIKIDVEGSEDLVLKGLSQPIRYLSFETLLPDYLNELRRCLDSIHSLDKQARYNFAADEKIILPQFIDRDQIEQRLMIEKNYQGVEVIIKMSI